MQIIGKYSLDLATFFCLSVYIFSIMQHKDTTNIVNLYRYLQQNIWSNADMFWNKCR
jgi:hypothetical protein